MTFTPITHGTPEWDDDLNAQLEDLDTRLTDIESADLGVTSVNDDPGPAVVFTLDDVADVFAPPVVFDQDTGQITSQPGQGDVLQWDQDTGLYLVGPPEVVASHTHDERYAPINWEPPYFVKSYVYNSGTSSIPTDLPVGTIIFDVANPAAVVVTSNTTSTVKVPIQVTGIARSTPTQTSSTISWTAVTTTTPSGGPAITGYRIYRGGVLVRSVGLVTSSAFTDMTAGNTYSYKVSAVNADGEGAQSAAVSVTTQAASGVPGAPSNLHTTAVGETTVDLAWDVETPDPFAPTSAYNVYRVGTGTPVSTVTTRTAHIIGLVGSTDYGFYVKAVNSVGESTATATLPVTTDNPTSSGATIRSDDVLNYWGVNAKISYGAGTVYGDNTVSTWENTDACANHIIETGARIWREKLAISGSARLRQRRAMPIMAAAGVRWHTTIGVLSDARDMTISDARTWAHDTVQAVLAELAGFYYTNAPVAGSMSSILASVGGPNEVDNTALNGANWARNAYLLQKELWAQMRLGSVVPTYVSRFAGIPILAPSVRSNLLDNPSLGTTLGANITGEGRIRDWCDYKNPHKYQGGVCPTQAEVEESLAAWEPIAPGKPAIFTETGYNSMNYDKDSNYIGGGVNHTGAPKIPPWVMGVYVPKALATFAQQGCGYYIHELLDDADPATTFDIQSHFGMISMQGSTTAASPPAGWIPKPSYYAMRRLANLLYDRTNPNVAPTFTPTDLPHTTSVPGGTGVNFQKLVTQKANGRWYMLIWREVDQFTNSETSYGTDITVANIDVDITVPQARTYNTYKPNDATAGSPLGTTTSTSSPTGPESGTVSAGGTFTIPLGANLKVVEIY